MMLSARQGHPAAEFWIGFNYQYGLAATKFDVFEAARWFRLSADQGNRDAERYLGDLYNTGDGVLQDFTEATKLYAAAAEQGDDAAQELLAGQYLEGRGVQRDLIRAHFWYNVSASAHVADEVRERRRAAHEATARQMNQNQIGDAQRLAREWKPQS